jgi:molybdopterin-containing oxidoreductase family iron-sulfur binding subunit
MEKCTFCVQRINHAQHTATVEGREVEDGEFTTACAAACPTRAIVFGDLLNEGSEVAQVAASSNRAYRLLEDLGTDPAVFYLKKVDPDAPEHVEADH